MSRIIDSIIYSDDLKKVEGVKDKSITTARIKDGVIEIRSSAFKGCKSMTSVTLPKTVKMIGKKAFRNCPSLSNVTIAGGISKLKMSLSSDMNF